MDIFGVAILQKNLFQITILRFLARKRKLKQKIDSILDSSPNKNRISSIYFPEWMLSLVHFHPFSHSSFICFSFNLVCVANCGNDVAPFARKKLPSESQMDPILLISGLSIDTLIYFCH